MTPCKFNNCENKAKARGLCEGHYQQQRRGRSLAPLQRRAKNGSGMGKAEQQRRERYGLWPEQFQALIEKQNGKCAICSTEDPGGHGDWHVDHDHSCCDYKGSCGKCVRGLLCQRCNIGLGYFQDNNNYLQSAINYLSRSL